MRIGIVGAENSHCAAVARTLNVQKACGRARVVAVWGETRAFAEKAAEAGQIPEIVKRPEDMIGKIDGVMVDHRHAKYHLAAATPFVEAGVPAFVDKPFCFRLAEGKRFLALARRKRVAVTSHTMIISHRVFRDYVKKAKRLRPTGGAALGPCDIRSKWGGVFFYGIHLVEAVMELFGIDVKSVQVTRRGKTGVAVLHYADGRVVTLHLLPNAPGWHLTAWSDKGVLAAPLAFDPNPFLTSTREWVHMMKTGKEPMPHRRLLAPVAVLEAMEKSLKDGKKHAVAAF